MKRLGLIMMGVALVLGLAQCKKNVEPLASGVVPGVGDGEIVLRLVGESSKLAVFPATGAVYYTEGDVIHVASGGTYRGTLTYHSDDDGGYFSGSLTSTPSSGAKLYFYFVGNKSLNEGSPTSSISVNISDQTENYPVIACGESVEGYGETTEYHATMKNKCALVKFNVRSSASSSTPTVVFGMNTVIKFTFSSSGVGTAATSSVGSIKLRGGSGERWAVALKQNEVESLTKKYVANSEIVTSAHGSIPAINDNDYLSRGIGVTVTYVGEGVDGSIPGEFTINSSGGKVYFSQGNLQYQASTGTWRFAENQYDYIGNAAGNNVTMANGRATQAAWIDLFGWGTSGYNDKYPYMVSTTTSDYGNGTTHIAGTNYDWGVYNAISNGGNEAGLWRTLTNAEGNYVFATRSTTSGVKYAKAQVNGKNGIILLPDDWSTSYYALSTPNTASANYTTNIIDYSTWSSSFEAHGAVFLPAAGTMYNMGFRSVGTDGDYWYSTYRSADNAYILDFDASSNGYGNNGTRARLRSVRLVRNVN